MVGSIRSFLSGIVDYAGLISSAPLPEEQALKNYLNYMHGQYAWMLSRFVCPAGRFREIEAHAEALFSPGQPQWRFSVLGRGGDDIESFLQNLQDDLSVVQEFVDRHEGAVLIDKVEVNLPPAVVAAGGDEIVELAERAAAVIANHTTASVTVHYEVGFEVFEPAVVAAALTSLKKFNDRWASKAYPAAGARIRTGGRASSACPSCKQVAFFVSACRNLGLAFVVSEGLDHTLRQFDSTVNAEVHGFINVFVAAVLSYALRVDLQTLVSVLECESSEEFVFSDEVLKWRDLEVSESDISSARNELGLSFGSGNFDEPIEGLKRLGIL